MTTFKLKHKLLIEVTYDKQTKVWQVIKDAEKHFGLLADTFCLSLGNQILDKDDYISSYDMNDKIVNINIFCRSQ